MSVLFIADSSLLFDNYIHPLKYVCLSENDSLHLNNRPRFRFTAIDHSLLLDAFQYLCGMESTLLTRNTWCAYRHINSSDRDIKYWLSGFWIRVVLVTKASQLHIRCVAKDFLTFIVKLALFFLLLETIYLNDNTIDTSLRFASI